MTDIMITISMQIFEDMADRIEELEAKLAQQDDLVQAAVAAALRQAAGIEIIAMSIPANPRHAYQAALDAAAQHILALITLDAQAALDRVVAAEWRDAIALMTGIVDDCLLVDAQGKIIDFEYTDFQMRIAAIRKGRE
jgi:hypothetical protein